MAALAHGRLHYKTPRLIMSDRSHDVAQMIFNLPLRKAD
jgi:hypothetical protein